MRVHPNGTVSFIEPAQADDGAPTTEEYTLLQYDFASLKSVTLVMAR